MNTLQYRPVYVLGAGFSKAINNDMPLTNDLGASITKRFHQKTGRDIGYKSGSSFEEWFSIIAQDMPFLRGYENVQRMADAELLVSLIADGLEEIIEDMGSVKIPLWLRQIIDIWNIEQAKIITFNYDTLLERAINDVMPLIVTGSGPCSVRGDEVVFPRPHAEPDGSPLGMDTQACVDTSMQLLKLHGSLNWYWAPDDPLGSTLRRIPVRTSFEDATKHVDPTVQGLEKFLIPPLSSKSKYYHPYLTRSLWREAYTSIRHASSITLMGYSLPRTDQVTAQLLGVGKNPNIPLNIVDLNTGTTDNDSVTKRALQATGIAPAKLRTFDGESCFTEFINEHIVEMASSIELENLIQSGDSDTCLLLSTPVDVTGSSSSRKPELITLRSGDNGVLPDEPVKRGELWTMPASEVAQNKHPQGRAPELSSYLSSDTAHHILEDGGKIVINQPKRNGEEDARKLIVIGAKILRIDGFDNIVFQVTHLDQR